MVKRITPGTDSEIVADWKTGIYSQNELADKHHVSKGKVNKLCKGVAQDTASIVTAGVIYKQGLAEQDDQNVTAVTNAVEERTRYIQFFTDSTMRNMQSMMKKVDIAESIMEHRQAQAALKDAKEVVIGKAPETAIQINNVQPVTQTVIPDDPIEASRAYQRLIGGC